jgi:hypothetical protein
MIETNEETFVVAVAVAVVATVVVVWGFFPS